MFNIIDFIDSPDIREYNKDYTFAPSEQAILIAMSENTTIYEKINAWQELLDTYTEEEFKSKLVKLCCIDTMENIKATFRSIVQSNINVYRNTITNNPDNVVYAAYITYDGLRDVNSPYYTKFCSTFKKAYTFIKKYHDEYSQNDTEQPIYIIDRIYIDENYMKDSFGYDKNLRLVYVDPEYYREGVDSLSSFVDLKHSYMYLPTPFRIGDIIKWHCMFREDEYGVISTNPPLSREDRSVQLAGDYSDLILFMDGYNKNEGFYYIDGFPVLDCYCVDPKDLPDEYKPLIALSAVLTGKLDLGTFAENANSHENLMDVVDNYKLDLPIPDYTLLKED